MFDSLFDAYTVRKIAPRLIVAVIGVNLSIYLCVAAVDITNIIGGGIADLLRQPFKESGAFESIGLPGNTIGTIITGGAGIVGVVGIGAGLLGSISTFGWAAVAGGAVASLPAFMLFLLVALIPVVLIVLAIAATLVIRYGAILILTLFAPIAIALLVLPGTEKYFKVWWDIFMKVLIMYPIIAIIFAMSDILGALLLVTLDQQIEAIAFVAIIVVIIAMYAPLFMIPFAYKMAGGVIGGIYDFANKNGTARVGERLKKMKDDPHSAYGKYMAGKKQNRREAGLNAGDMARGLRGGFRARNAPRPDGMSRRRALQKAYQGAYGSKGGADLLNKELEEHQKKGYGHKVGYDDHYRAMLEVEDDSDLEGIMTALIKEDPSKYGMDEHRFGATQQAALEIQDEMKAAGGVEQAHRIAVMSMMDSVTAFKNSGDMIEQVEKAAGGDSTLRSMMLAKVQKTQDGLGRHDVAGAGFTNTSLMMEAYVAKKNELQKAGVSGKALEKQMQAYGQKLHKGVDEEAGEKPLSFTTINSEGQEETTVLRSYRDMVEEKKSDVAQGQGHERSLNDMMEHKMKGFAKAVKKAEARVKDPNDTLTDVSLDEKVQEYTAKLENMGEASAYFSGANRELVSKVLRGENVTELAGAKFKVSKEETSIPALKINTTVKDKRPKMENGQVVTRKVEVTGQPGVFRDEPVMEVYDKDAVLSVRQLADEKMRSSEAHQVYNTNKREFGRAKADMDEAAREEAARLGGLGPHAGSM